MKDPVKHRPVNSKTVVITGATSGVGRAAALAFASRQATLVLAGRRTAVLSEIAEECKSFGANVLTVTTDVKDQEAVKRLASEAVSFGGRVDVWINNAGVLAAGAFDETPIEIHEQVIQTNLLGYIYGAHAILPYFKEQGFGVLINNISVGAWLPTPFATGYSASKFGLLGFSESLRGELQKWEHIHVCNLFPAFQDTPGIQHAANYTGKVLQPAPPVYSPARPASAMVELAQNPKNTTTTDIAAPALKTAYTLFPNITVKLTGQVIQSYLAQADPIGSTTGNVLGPVKYGAAISGGWQYLLTRKALPKLNKVAILAVAAGIGIMMLRGKA